jgi:nitrite reductase/ring-hydroxylating ferredoxin subunit
MKMCCLILLSLIGLSCGKTDTSFIPNVSVNYSAPLSDPRLSNLTSLGGACYISGGVSGIIVYRESDGSYAAYDRCSSYQPEKRCAVTIDNPSLTATDACSGAKFSLSDGSPVKAPATRSLKAYVASVTNNELYVYN